MSQVVLKWINTRKACVHISVIHDLTKQQVYDKENSSKSRKFYKYRIYDVPDDFVMEQYMAENIKLMKYHEKRMLKYMLHVFAHKQAEEKELEEIEEWAR